MRLGFDRCYALDTDDAEPRPTYLSPLVLAQTFTAVVVLFMLLAATPFWHGSPTKPTPAGPTVTAVAVVAAPAAP